MIEVTWHDGTVDTADDAEAMLEKLAAKQMDTKVDVRLALAKRALYWSEGKVVIDPDADAIVILEGLAEAGMLNAVRVAP